MVRMPAMKYAQMRKKMQKVKSGGQGKKRARD